VACRVLLFDRNGQPIDPGTAGSMMNGYQMYGISAKNFSRIARAVVQTTPYIWAEFRNVPLLPNFEKDEAARIAAHAASLESGIHGTAVGIAPGFTKTLSDGTTVSITSVTKAIVDNQKWVISGQPSWRADGEVLAERPNQYWYEVPYSPKYPNPLEIIGVNFEKMKSDAMTVVRFTSKFDPKTHQPVFGGDTRTISVGPDDRFGAAQVGVASGPWETASSVDIDMQELPRVESGDRGKDQNNQVRTGFEVVVGKDCFVRDMMANSKVAMPCGPRAKNAVRVMARLKTGELRELRMGMSGPEGMIYPVPSRHGEWTEGYSRLLASEVKSVEIQVRPYEFVQFDGIALQHR